MGFKPSDAAMFFLEFWLDVTERLSYVRNSQIRFKSSQSK